MRARNLFLSLLLGLGTLLWVAPSLVAAAQNTIVLAEPKSVQAVAQIPFSTPLDAVADNTLYEEADGLLSNGAGEYFFVGRTGQVSNSLRRGLIRFDVAGSLPTGAIIQSATLYLTASATKGGPQTIELHRVTADWGEGSSDANLEEGKGISSTLGDATWIHTFYSSTLWTTPGGDFVITASASTTVDGAGAYNWSATDLVSDVQTWLDTPATNYGWLLLGNESSGSTAKRFATHENMSADMHPVLVIDYVLPYATYLPVILR